MSTSVSSVTNHFPSAENGFATTTSSQTLSGATTVELEVLTGYDNGEVVVFIIEPNSLTAKQTFTGVVDIAGSQITNVVWTAGTNQTHAVGVAVVDYATATHVSMISKGLAVEHNQDGTHKASAAATLAPLISDAIGEILYPVGSIYINATVATNPGTLLGFGTWVAFGAGRVPVGLNSGDVDFDTAEETGGAKTSTIATANLPSHTHSFSATTGTESTTHTHGFYRWSAAIQNAVAATDAARYIVQGENYESTGGQSTNHTHSVSGTSGATGSGTALSVLNPYIVVYMWKRTV